MAIDGLVSGQKLYNARHKRAKSICLELYVSPSTYRSSKTSDDNFRMVVCCTFLNRAGCLHAFCICFRINKRKIFQMGRNLKKATTTKTVRNK